MHPFVPVEQAAGYQADLPRTRSGAGGRSPGLPAVSLQPNSGAQGEFAGLLVIQAYHASRGDSAARRRADSAVRARHQSGQRRDGRHVGRHRRLRRPRQHRRRRSAREGRGASRSAVVPDGDVSEHARRVRGSHPRDLRDRARARRPGVHGRREHERAGRADEPGGDRRRRLPPQPAQDVRDSARRRRSRHGADCASPRTWRRSCRAIRSCRRAARTAIPPVSAAPWGSASILLISYGYIRMLGADGVDRGDDASRCSTPTTSRRGSSRTIRCCTPAATAASRTS